MELYLDLIYKREVIIYDWRDAIRLFEFSKFTQTSIPRRDIILGGIVVPSNEFVEYVQALSQLYDSGIPVEVIKLLKVPDINKVKLSDLGEDFVSSLIENTDSEVEKYLIANKAVSEGMDKRLYSLVQLEALNSSLINPESLPYLRQVDPNMLSSGKDIMCTTGPHTVAIVSYTGFYQESAVYFDVNGSDTKNPMRIAFRGVEEFNDEDETIVLLMADGSQRNAEELKPGTVIKFIPNYYYDLRRVKRVFVDNYEIVNY